MSFRTERHEHIPGSKSLFPQHRLWTALTTTEIRSKAAMRSCAAVASSATA